MGRGSSSGVPRSLIVFTVLSVLMFVLGIREGDSGLLHGARGVFQTLATPARVVGSVVASPVAAGVGAAHKPVQPGFAVTPGLSLTLHQSMLRVQADDDADDAPVPVGACGISAHAATAKAA